MSLPYLVSGHVNLSEAELARLLGPRVADALTALEYPGGVWYCGSEPGDPRDQGRADLDFSTNGPRIIMELTRLIASDSQSEREAREMQVRERLGAALHAKQLFAHIDIEWKLEQLRKPRNGLSELLAIPMCPGDEQAFFAEMEELLRRIAGGDAGSGATYWVINQGQEIDQFYGKRTLNAHFWKGISRWASSIRIAPVPLGVAPDIRSSATGGFFTLDRSALLARLMSKHEKLTQYRDHYPFAELHLAILSEGSSPARRVPRALEPQMWRVCREFLNSWSAANSSGFERIWWIRDAAYLGALDLCRLDTPKYSVSA